MEEKKIIVIDDEEFIRINLERIFSDGNYSVRTFPNGKEATAYLKENDADIAFLDLNLPDIHGIDLLKEIKEIRPELLVIIITGFASVESAVRALKLGAYDYIKKPFKADAIKLITKLALETQSLKRKVRELSERKEEKGAFEQLLGVSPAIKSVKQQIEQFAQYDEETVLITGESGVGKELVAKALHEKSKRAKKTFIEINCASLPENLLESELFGYEKGAFTDARERKIGLIEKANNGTIFLDEIGEMSVALQAKLLRLLENKQIRRLGATENISVNVRIIAATNKNLLGAIEKKEFRSDLYYRLNVLRIDVPPLRERKEDALILAKYFLNIYSVKFSKSIKGFSPEVEKFISSYDWPGNVRELKNVIERITILADNEIIKTADFPPELIGVAGDFDFGGANLEIGEKSLEELVQNFEREIISKVFEKNNYNISKTALELKVPRQTLDYKLQKYGIKTAEKSA
jgi:DNA-binding NtrC family response regulator